MLIGCSRPSNPSPQANSLAQERSLQEQVESVRHGGTKRILVSAVPFRGEFVEQLSGLSDLRELLVDQGGITEEHLEALLPKLDLNHLRIRTSILGDRGLRSIVSTQKHLKILNLPHSQFTREGVGQLQSLEELHFLRLGGDWIDDGVLIEIASIPSLESLHLIGPKLSDSSLKVIASIEPLRSFYLDDCKLSDQAWEEFFATRPRLHVHLDQAHHDRDPNKHETQ